jgi:hypothetical protein
LPRFANLCVEFVDLLESEALGLVNHPKGPSQYSVAARGKRYV